MHDGPMDGDFNAPEIKQRDNKPDADHQTYFLIVGHLESNIGRKTSGVSWTSGTQKRLMTSHYKRRFSNSKGSTRFIFCCLVKLYMLREHIICRKDVAVQSTWMIVCGHLATLQLAATFIFSVPLSEFKCFTRVDRALLSSPPPPCL
jgi:hypothetical protein